MTCAATDAIALGVSTHSSFIEGLVFLCLESREAIVSTSTEHPDSAWVVKQTEAFLEQTKD